MTDDCISRKAVLNTLEFCDKALDVDRTVESYKSLLAECYKMLSSIQPKPKWIPVSERLPENSGNYLITYCYQNEIETQEAVYVKDEEDKWFDITDIEITLAVIAWMPLPEPYKAESENKE